ncbi:MULTISPECIES: PP2C family protein-serine/threonine phosphatase [Streptomyces]|uniref:PP2C family protein-serine/threonine phosphatase n=1 Tax=Streptomyces abikoensis TaxID=97398 RepID=A0ABW7T973_9ACTN
MFVLPGLWVLAVVLWELLSPLGTQFIELLAATPAIACAGTGRRQCVLLGGACALLALVPPGASGRAAVSGRIGTCGAVLAVVAASYLISGRTRRLTGELERAREVAITAQTVLLRPLPPRLDGIALASRHVSAGEGALVGGDLYDALGTRYGVRVLMGDVRGHGLPALGTAAALLGSFRDAAHDEARLPDVLRRLERALHRHLYERDQRQPAGAGGDRSDAEEFATVLLLEVRAEGEVVALNCGHPWPHRLSGDPDGDPARGPGPAVLAPGDPLPPLGVFPLPAELSPLPLTRLLPGDVLVLHTDGVEDARDATGAFFPLAGALAEAARGAPPALATLVARVQAALLRHTGGPVTDDFALLALRNDRGPGPPAASRPPRALVAGP